MRRMEAKWLIDKSINEILGTATAFQYLCLFSIHNTRHDKTVHLFILILIKRFLQFLSQKPRFSNVLRVEGLRVLIFVLIRNDRNISYHLRKTLKTFIKFHKRSDYMGRTSGAPPTTMLYTQ